MSKTTHPPPYLLTTRCTIGISLPLTLYTTISPICVSMPLFQRKSRSPRWKAGSMEPERTTTMGDGEFETTERPFHIIKAVERTRAKLRTWAASCRGCMPATPNMLAGLCGCVGIRMCVCGFVCLERGEGYFLKTGGGQFLLYSVFRVFGASEWTSAAAGFARREIMVARGLMPDCLIGLVLRCGQLSQLPSCELPQLRNLPHLTLSIL